MRCNLDFPPLMDKRKVVWAECSNTITEYKSELELSQRDPTSVVARAGVMRAAEKLRKMVREEEELSAVAAACIRGTGDPRVIRFAG